MKITIGELINFRVPFQEFFDKDLPIEMSWELSRLDKKLGEELQIYEERRIAIWKKLGKDNGKGEIEVPKEKIQELNEKLNDLFNYNIEIAFVPIKKEVLVSTGIKIKPREISAFQRFGIIEDPEVKVKPKKEDKIQPLKDE